MPNEYKSELSPSKDIVERLNRWAENDVWARPLILDTTDEIERLREALAHVQKHLLMNDYGHYEMTTEFDIDILHNALWEKE